MAKRVSRREFLRVSALGAAGAAAAACATPTPEVVEVTREVEKEKVVTQVVKEVVEETVVVAGTPKVVEKVVEKVVTPTPAPMSYKESPMLAEMVGTGELLPLEERRPKDPLMIEAPGGEIGTYGGTAGFWNLSSSAVNMIFRYARLVSLSPLYGPNREYIQEPMIADWWEVSDDRSEFTFHIREGTKWSDGEPLTSEAFRFYWEDIVLYEQLAAAAGVRQYEAEIEVIDDFTFKIVFPQPTGTFLFDSSATWGGGPVRWMYFPMHYMKQFHPEYVDASELEATMNEYAFDSWDMLFGNRATWQENPDVPTFLMWGLAREPDALGVTYWMRNPCFYKVDAEGNQLPYIDYINGLSYDKDTAVMKQMQGEIDYGYRQWRVVHYAALKQGEFKGHYTTGNELNPKATQINLMMNQCTEDEVLREVFQDIRFRKAVSHAINREEIVDVVWNGLGEATGMTVGEYVAFWRPEWKDMYAEYDPALSTQLLDEMGLEWDANHEYRLRPDGTTLEVIYSTPGFFGGNLDANNLLIEYMTAIGIKVFYRQTSEAAHNEWAASNKSEWVDCSVTSLHEGTAGSLLSGGRENFGNQWTVWLESEGAEGMEPPEPMKKICELKIMGDQADTMEERMQAWGEATDLLVKELYIIGIAGHDVRPSTVHERLKNVRQDLFLQGVNPNLAVYPANFCMPETFYLDLDWSA